MIFGLRGGGLSLDRHFNCIYMYAWIVCYFIGAAKNGERRRFNVNLNLLKRKISMGTDIVIRAARRHDGAKFAFFRRENVAVRRRLPRTGTSVSKSDRRRFLLLYRTDAAGPDEQQILQPPV